MNMAKVKNITCKIYIVKHQRHGKGSIRGPLVDGIVEHVLVRLQSEIGRDFSARTPPVLGSHHEAVDGAPHQRPLALVLGHGTGAVVTARAVRAGRGDARFELGLVHVGAIGLVRETERVHPIRRIDLLKLVGHSFLHAESGIGPQFGAFFEFVVTQFACHHVNFRGKTTERVSVYIFARSEAQTSSCIDRRDETRDKTGQQENFGVNHLAQKKDTSISSQRRRFVLLIKWMNVCEEI
mmetsp:Transcript_12215/g.24368  ORF Transcript_12215/g.24368 Transcript_12215/m.24368 type:complete len:238 (-) Transcript_12215:99-812(-)